MMMEHATKETIFDELNNFEKKKPFDVPVILDEYLTFIAKTGDIIFPWPKLKPLFKCKLDKVIRKFKEDYPVEDMPYSPNIEKFNFDDMHTKLINILEEFTGAPFTIQRLCELVVHPDKHYKRVDKFLRALEKDLLVVSTVEPVNRRPSTDNGNSTAMNGVSESVFNSVNGSNTPGSPNPTFTDEVKVEQPVEFPKDESEISNKFESVSKAEESERREVTADEAEGGVFYSTGEACVSSSSNGAESEEGNDEAAANDVQFDKTQDDEISGFIDKQMVDVEVTKSSEANDVTNSENVIENEDVVSENNPELGPSSLTSSPSSTFESSGSNSSSSLTISSISETIPDSNQVSIDSQPIDTVPATFTSGYSDSNITELEPMEQDN